MASLSDQLRQAQQNAVAETDLVVTRPHAEWLERPEEERVITEEAAQFAKDVLLGKYKHPRVGRLSASGLGGCPRRQILGFHGYPQVGDDPDSIDLMSMGTHDHLWWQVEGLSMGYMRAGEVWLFDPASRLGGSMDAELVDGSPFELKTVMWGPYREQKKTGKPREDHWMQFDFYGEEKGWDVGSVVYQERGTGSFHEFRVERDDVINRKRLASVARLNEHIEDSTLPMMLADCTERTGKVYRSCPFRKSCPKAGNKVPNPAAPLTA